MPRTLPVLATLALACAALSGCIQKRTEMDPGPVAERYSFRHEGSCSSWLRSSKTGYLYCASPVVDVPFDVPVAAPAEGTAEEVVAEVEDMEHLMKRGEQVYNAPGGCASCHQADGKGLGASFPPLAGAGDYYGDGVNHAVIIIKGLSGPITVAGTDYNGAMPPQAALSDYEVAAVATYERNSWGNSDGMVTLADVAAARAQ